MTGLPTHAHDTKDNNTRAPNGSSVSSGRWSDWLEPVPNWSEAVAEWGAAWNVHLVLFASFFMLQIVLTACLTVRFCRKTLRIQIITHTLSFVCVSGALRFAFFLLGPYGFENNLSGVCSHLFAQAINPSICASYGFVQMIVVKITGIGIGSERLRNRKSILLALTACFLCMLSVHGVVALDRSLKALLLLDSCFYVAWMMFMCVTFVCSGFRLSQYAWEAKQARLEFLTRQKRKAALMMAGGGADRVCNNNHWGWFLLWFLCRRVRTLCLYVQTRAHRLTSCVRSCCRGSGRADLQEQEQPQRTGIQSFDERDCHESADFHQRHSRNSSDAQCENCRDARDLESHDVKARGIQADCADIIHDRHGRKSSDLEHQSHVCTHSSQQGDHSIIHHLEYEDSSQKLLHASVDVQSHNIDKLRNSSVYQQQQMSQESLAEYPMLTEKDSAVQGVRRMSKDISSELSFREDHKSSRTYEHCVTDEDNVLLLRSDTSVEWAKLHATENNIEQDAARCSGLRTRDEFDPDVHRETPVASCSQSHVTVKPDCSHDKKTCRGRQGQRGGHTLFAEKEMDPGVHRDTRKADCRLSLNTESPECSLSYTTYDRHHEQRGRRAPNEMDYLLPIPHSRRSENRACADEMRSTESDISTSSRPADCRGEVDLKQEDIEWEVDADDSQDRDTNEYSAGRSDLRGASRNWRPAKPVVTNEAATTSGSGLKEIVHRRKQRKQLSLLRRTSLLRKQLPEDEIVSAVSESKWCEIRIVGQKGPDQPDTVGDVVNGRSSDTGISLRCGENDFESDNYSPRPRNKGLQNCLNWLKFAFGMRNKFQNAVPKQTYQQCRAHSSIECVDDGDRSPSKTWDAEKTRRTGHVHGRSEKQHRLQKRAHEHTYARNKRSKRDSAKLRTIHVKCCCVKVNLTCDKLSRHCRGKSLNNSKRAGLGSCVRCEYHSSDVGSSSHESDEDSFSGDDGYIADNEHLESPYRTPKSAPGVSQNLRPLRANQTTPVAEPSARKREKQPRRQVCSLPAGHGEQKARSGMAHSETTFTLLPDDDVNAVSNAKFKQFHPVPSSSSSAANALPPRDRAAADRLDEYESEWELPRGYFPTSQRSKQIHELQAAPRLTTSSDDSLSDPCAKHNFRSSLDDEYANEPAEQERARTHAQNPISADLFRIRRAVMVGQVVQWTYVLTFVHMFLCLLEMYKAFGRYGVLWAEGGASGGRGGGGGRGSSTGSVGVKPLSAWPWLTFQTLCRLTEVASGYVTLGILFVVLRHRNRRRK